MSANLKIETGRWSGMKRTDRLCPTCKILGDEYHVIYQCCEIFRDDIDGLPEELSAIWEFPGTNTIFKRMIAKKYVD